jgi:hypothetical protein
MVARFGLVGTSAALLVACHGPIGPVKNVDPTQSTLYVNTVTLACVPLRAEFTVDGATSVRGLYVEPDCPSPGTTVANCYQPPEGHEPCPFSCPQVTYWKTGSGTAPMHRFQFPIADDGTNSGSMTVVFHLRLATLDGELVSARDVSAESPVIAAHGAGYFHEGAVEVVLEPDVHAALGETCLPPPS